MLAVRDHAVAALGVPAAIEWLFAPNVLLLDVAPAAAAWAGVRLAHHAVACLRADVARRTRTTHHMPRYIRILNDREAGAIRATGVVPPNRSWCDPYPAGTVVFLFGPEALDRPNYPRVERSLVEACYAELEDEFDETPRESPADGVRAYRLEFEADIPVEPDESGWKALGGVVYRYLSPLKLPGDYRLTPLSEPGMGP